MSNEELQELKEQIKQEILSEMNTRKRVCTVWEIVKKEYEEQIEEVNKIPNDNHSLEDAIRTIQTSYDSYMYCNSNNSSNKST